MLELLKDALPALQNEASNYSDGARIWMRVMAVSFFSGIIFALVSNRAWLVFAMAVLTLGSLVFGKVLYPEISRTIWGSATHLILWPIVLFLFLRSGDKPRAVPILSRIYPVWKYWVSALIVISLVLDLWAIFRP